MTHKTLRESRPATMEARLGSWVRGEHPIRNTWILLGLLFSVFVALPPRAASARGHDGAPREFNAAACYQLVEDAGRPIAWARWEKGFSLEKTRSPKFHDDTPLWMIRLVQEWIADAYQWRASDEQIRQWAAELGSVDDLPSAERLSVHETIAIWMRRIARGCGERDAHAGA
jgi:hypothetical protein